MNLGRVNMGGKLKMYNVQFGDAFLLYGQGENLLVDLGSIQREFNFTPIRDSIREESADKQLSLLLSHFHRDHWSGLRNQPVGHMLPSLNRVYIPDIFRMRRPGKVDVVVRSLLSEFLEAVLLERRPAFSLADLLREVLPGLPKERICLLSRGDVFQMGGQSYEVLWPHLDEKSVVPRRNRQFQIFLERIESKLAIGEGEVGLLATLEAIADMLLKEFRDYLDHDNLERRLTEPNSYENLYFQIGKLAESLSEELKRDIGELREKTRYYAGQLSQDWNRISLVFQERTEEMNYDGVLMTGDAPISVLKKLEHGDFSGPKLQTHFAVIKAPHHGTKTHFCDILPNCRYICISNGSGNHGYEKISEQYEYVYGCLGKKVDIYCTNTRCEFLERKKFCPFPQTSIKGISYDIFW